MRPPDPERIATQQDFGRELTAVRMAAGLTVRAVARTAGLPASTTGDYFSGRHLPAHTQPEPVLQILRACGQTDPAALARWTDALRRAKRSPGRRRRGDAPYRGLARFETGDARWFFGREAVAGRLAELAAATSELPLMLVGASGSGKSSLLRAGLIPLLGGRPFALLEPGRRPLEALDAIPAADAADGSRPAIIVDQFEAVFTDCDDETQRRAFVRELARLAAGTLVVLALRADFYEPALRYPELARALQARQLVLGPMTPEQVRRAVVEPARLARVEVEDGLVELLLRDLAPAAASETSPGEAGPAAYEAGALPLLSHALLATWERSHGGVITVADYVASGGISDALIRTAEDAYGALGSAERPLARRLFLQLVHVADDAPPSRAAVPPGELRTAGGADAEAVLDRFVAERLITVGADRAQITHDALIAAWPRLRGWIEDGIDDLRTRRRIGQAARAWQVSGREAGALWRGSQLALAAEWAADDQRRASLGDLGRDFLRACLAAARAREVAARRRTRRLQRLVAALAVLTIAVLGLAAYAFAQRQVAATARDDANSRAIAVEAGQLRNQDAPLAAQLSAAAYGIARTPQATASLLESSGSPSAERLVDSAGVVESVAINPDRTVLAAAADDGTVRLWDIAAPGHPKLLAAPQAGNGRKPLYAIAFGPNGHLLAAAGAAHTVTLWDVRDPAHPVRLSTLTGPASTVYSVAVSPDGRILAAGSADKTVRLWDISDPARPVALGGPLTGAAGYVESVAFAPGGTILAAASADKSVRLWDISDPAHPAALGAPLTGPADTVSGVAFSPDGHLLAAASQDDKVWLWRVSAAGATPDGTLTGATDWVNAVAFSPDGSQLAAATSDASVLVWNLSRRSLVATLPHPQPVTSLAWDGPGKLAAGDADGTVSVWQVPPPVLLTGSPAYDAVFSPDGATLAVSSQDSLQLWNAASRTQRAAAAVPGTFVNAVAFGPHSQLLAAGYGDGLVQLWSTADGLRPLGSPVRASATGQVEAVALSPDGQTLVTGGDDGTMRLWSVRDPASPQLLADVHDAGSFVFGVAFSPSGTTVAATSIDHLTRLWNVADPRHPVLLGRPLRGFSGYAIAVAFSPDGRLLAVGSADGTVRLWNVADPRHPAPVSAPLTGPTGYVYGVAFNSAGTTLAAASTDGTVWLWSLASPAHPAVVAALAGPAGHVYSVAFAPRSDVVAAASADGTVRLWDTSPAAADRAVCGDAGQPMSGREWATYAPGVPYRVPCP